MGFLDKVTKAVSDTVDRGKKEVDQFMRVQKVKGEISQVEAQVASAGARAQQVKIEIGERVIVRLRDGSLAAPELLELADRVAAIDQEIAGCQATIAEKRAAIVAIENEDEPATAPVAPPPPAAQAAPPVPSAAPPQAAVPPPLPAPAPSSAPAPAVPPPLPTTAASVCPQCGRQVGAADTFCTECGAKL
jgi:hypothetical protein